MKKVCMGDGVGTEIDEVKRELGWGQKRPGRGENGEINLYPYAAL